MKFAVFEEFRDAPNRKNRKKCFTTKWPEIVTSLLFKNTKTKTTQTSNESGPSCKWITAIIYLVKKQGCVWFGCETKPPILEFDKTAGFENGTKSPILKWDKTADL